MASSGHALTVALGKLARQRAPPSATLLPRAPWHMSHGHDIGSVPLTGQASLDWAKPLASPSGNKYPSSKYSCGASYEIFRLDITYNGTCPLDRRTKGAAWRSSRTSIPPIVHRGPDREVITPRQHRAPPAASHLAEIYTREGMPRTQMPERSPSGRGCQDAASALGVDLWRPSPRGRGPGGCRRSICRGIVD